MRSESDMSTTRGMTHSYNRDSRTQQEDFVRYLDTLLECIDVAVTERAQLYSLIDYGCSLGANSVLAMSRLIQYLHEKKSINTFNAYHNDLPSNDFNALLKNLCDSTHNYQHIPGCQVFTQLVPSSFFQQVVPDWQIDLGFTIAAAHWLTRIPDSDYRNAVYLSDVNQQAQMALLDQTAKDWQSFARARSKEIKPGGLLFIMALSSDIDSAGCREVAAAGLFVVVKKVLKKMVADKQLSQESLDNFIFPVVPRTREEFLAPFECGELSGDWHCLHSSIEKGIASDYIDYQKHRDARLYAEQYTRFFRSFSQATMFDNLFYPGATTMPAVELCDLFYARFCQEIEISPEEGVFHHIISNIVLQRV
jgi:SAM dependent carboxyl methyltransferase